MTNLRPQRKVFCWESYYGTRQQKFVGYEEREEEVESWLWGKHKVTRYKELYEKYPSFDEFMAGVKDFIANIGPENLITVQERCTNPFTEIYVWYWENVPVPTQSE